MAILNQDIIVYRGAAAILNFTMVPPEDITGWTIALTVARANGSGTKAIGPLTATATLPSAGQFRVPLTATLTDIRPADYLYDVWRVDAGLEEPLAFGGFALEDVVRLPPI